MKIRFIPIKYQKIFPILPWNPIDSYHNPEFYPILSHIASDTNPILQPFKKIFPWVVIGQPSIKYTLRSTPHEICLVSQLVDRRPIQGFDHARLRGAPFDGEDFGTASVAKQHSTGAGISLW